MPPRLSRTKERELALADVARATDGSGTNPDTQELPIESQATTTHDEAILIAQLQKASHLISFWNVLITNRIIINLYDCNKLVR
jgi:hypothetical protein